MLSKLLLELNSDKWQLSPVSQSLMACAKILTFTFHSYLSFVPFFFSLSHSHNSFYYGFCVVHQNPFPSPPVPPSCKEAQQNLLQGLIINDYFNYI